LEDSYYIPIEKINSNRDKSEEAKSLTLGLIRYLRTKKNKELPTDGLKA
jgi:hypothetical protein